MAILIIQEPEANKLYLSRSPIIITLQEQSGPAVNDKTYRYVCRVRYWNTQISNVPLNYQVELISFPNILLYGVFNVSPILEGLFKPRSPLIGASDSLVGIYAVKLEYGRYIDGVYNIEDESGVFYTVPGYGVYQQLVNKYEKFNEINDCEAFLNPQKEITISPDYNGAIHVFRSNTATRKYVYIQDDQGNDFEIQLDTLAVEVRDQIVRIPIGKEAVSVASGGVLIPERSCSFTLALDDGNSISFFEKITVKYKAKDYCYIEDDNVFYINRFGVWDSVSMRGRASEVISQKRTRFIRRNAINSDQSGAVMIEKGVSRLGVVGVEGNKSLLYNTGNMDEEQNKQISDLLLSGQFYSENEEAGIHLETESISVLKQSNSELINYEIRFITDGNIIQNAE